MHILLSGFPSLLGSAIMESFFNSGHTLHSFPLQTPQGADIEKTLDEKTGGQHMALVVLLAGEELLNATFTKSKIVKHCADQIEINERVCNYFAKKHRKPKIILSVSSVFYYTNAQNEPASESSNYGTGFLANYFKKLENVTKLAEKSGIRVVHLRLGKVISKSTEPVFPKIPFLRKSIPAIFHDKSRLMSWISQEDAVRAIYFICKNKRLSGPINIVSGDTVSKDEFNKLIAKEFSLRKTPPLPTYLLKIILGEETTCLFKASTRAIPVKLMKAGFLFNNISIEEYYQKSI